MDAWNDYLDKFDEKTKKLLESVLNSAKKYASDSTESMPYGVPGLKINNKPLIAVAAHKNHYGVYPFSPSVIQQAKNLIGDRETSEGTIRFKYEDYPSEELIRKLVELRSEEIAKK